MEGHITLVTSVVFSADGWYIASCSVDHTVRLWDAVTREELAQFDHPTAVISVAFSPDGTHIVSVSADRTIFLWDVRSLEGPFKCRVHRSALFPAYEGPIRLKISLDARYIVFSNNNNVRLWDIQRNEAVNAFKGHTGVVTALAFSLDGRYFVSASMDTTMHVWNAKTRVLLCVLNDPIKTHPILGGFAHWCSPLTKNTLFRAPQTGLSRCGK
jgi:WD40 repeat protein